MKQIYFIPPEKKWWNQLIQLFFISISLFILLPNTSNAQWTRKADALRNRGECPSVSYKGKIYVFGGFGEHPSIEKDNEVYDPVSNTWSLIASFPAGKEVTHQGLVNIDDKVWHIGGRLVDANGPTTNKVIIYDITNNTWADGPELMDPANGQPLPLGGGGAALVGRTIHVFGGFSTDLCVDQSTYHLTLDVDRWLADPQNTRWENNRAPLPLPRNHMSTAVLGGKIYVFGGQTSHDCGAQEQVYNHMYDPLTNTWTRITDLPSPRSHCEPSTFATDGNIYMVGGQGPSNASQNTVYLFNPRTNGGLGSWSNLTNYRLPNYYYGISAKIINNLFIISHGAIKSIRNTKASTYTSPVTRNTPYEFGFLAPCFTKTVAASQQAIVKNILYTIEGEKQYSLTSDAPWLTISKNASGTVLPTGVEVEATINTATLAPGSYTANITAMGTGGGTTYKSSSFCVNLTVSSADGSYTLAVSTVGSGSVIKSPFQTTYEAGTTVTLTATAAQGYQFAGWSGDATGTTNPLSLTMNSNKSVTATFEPVAAAQYTLTITSPTNGSISKDPDQASYEAGSVVNLTATPAAGYQFAGWTGDASGTTNPLPLTMDSNKTISATFTAIPQTQYTLTITPPTNGSISKNPDQESYTSGSSVTLTATPAQGYQFAGWTGDASGMTNPLSVTMNSNKNISANFTSTTPEPQPLLLFTPTSATVNIPGNQQKELKVNLNNSDEDPVTVQLTATEGQGTNVPGWLLYNGKALSAANNVTYNLGSSGNEVLFTINSSSLSPGTYTAKVVASATGYTSAELAITMEVSTYDESQRPYVTAVRPADGEISVSLPQSVSVDIAYPSGRSIDGNTVNTNTVKLYKVIGGQKTEVNGTAVNATAAGDAITLSAPLLVNTTYEFVITDQVKDGNGYMMQPFTSRFTTVTSTNDNPTDLSGVSFTEQVLIDNSFGTDGFTSLIIGPDNRLYATTSGGKIERWDINQDGTLSNYVSISPFGANRRLLIGFHFDPSATASNLIAWISHSAPEFADAPDWSGKISRINLNNPSNPQLVDYVTNLPRSSKDHTTNGIDFGSDGALYFLQGSNTAMGAQDGAWANRNERLLTAAVLRLDISKAEQQSLPIDVKTEEGGNYNPYGSNAPLTIFASGVRNAYDLVWHTNGQLYVPTNGSAAGGSTPALPSGTIWSDGQIYTGPDIPSMTDVRDTQNDYLFRIASGGYYGHPNPLRNEYILNGGNPTAGEDPAEIVWTTNGTTYGYHVGTPVEPNYRGWAFDFGLNKSPNGVIEYKSNAFDGKLKGKILVCRFSGGDDIMVLEPGTSNFDIIRATEGSAIPGFRRPFSNPLDLIEDTRNGNIYISEYFDGNGDGKPRITLLKVNQTNTPPPPAAANLINSGGGEYTDIQNRTWSADASFSGGIIGTKSFDIIGTTDDALYLNYRFAASAAPFSYNFTGTENGTYSVRLHFIEPYFGAPGGRAGGVGKRVFHVDIEGQRVLSNYDIFAQEGAAKAVVKTFDNVSVADGSLTIAFTSVTDNAIISAIEFVKTTAATATLTASTLKENRSDMEVYPNPAQGGKSVFVDLNRFGNKETILILIHDETGHLIQSLPTKTDTTGKALVELPVLSGFYIIRAESKTKVLSRKLIVN